MKVQQTPVRRLTFLACIAAMGLGFTTLQTAEPGPSTKPTPQRLPPRAQLSEAEYAAQATSLRELYSKPAAEWPTPTLDEGVEHRELGPLPEVKFPENNPFSKEKAELGKLLFFDGRLSGTGQMSCASCHDAELGWGDGRAFAFGHAAKPVKRNAMSLINAGLRSSFFWDGRAATLEEQALMPIGNPDEMHSSGDEAAERVSKVDGYKPHFKAAFGSEEINSERIAQAIATYERTLVSWKSPFEHFVRGEKNALSDAAVRGLHLFRTEARCLNCHNGPTLTDEQFHDLGLSYYGRELQDLGRYEITKNPSDVGRFKTPSLRNVTRTGPYMHNGLFDLEGVLNMYNAGMATLKPKPNQVNDPLFPKKDRLLKPLGLNRQDLADLQAFLESLEETRQRVRAPKLPQ